ncbi:MAG: superoxide dismutase [Phycisphaeraceae bacterium]|nr:superoxide dismutase [Phycisphaeraceae bacterium]
MSFTLPPLPYSAAALEPVIDAKTMEIHHGKHHAAYVANANKALEGTQWADQSCPFTICAQLGDIPEKIRTAVRNNAGGHANHSLFWEVMASPSSGGGGTPSGQLAAEIDQAFGSFGGFQEAFGAAAAGRFGSGWAWLYLDSTGKLAVGSTANQDNPAMGQAVAGIGGKPILGLDVWEHAYYLNYQNRRPDYVKAWWGVVNWAKVGENLARAKG